MRGSPWVAFLLGLSPMMSVAAGRSPAIEAMNQPVEPFRIAGNLYYVRASDLTSFLFTSPSGHILLDGGLPETAPRIERNLEKLGFHLRDVKFLLNSHAHFDHAGGLAELQRKSGATLVASAGDAPLLSSGGEAATGPFPAIAPGRIIKDGESVRLGAIEVTAHLTPGHTPGCTTWTTTIQDDGRPLHAVFVCSTTVLPDYRLVGHPTYPAIASDYAHSFQVLAALPCDLFLAAHGQFFDLAAKRERMGKAKQNPFIDPNGYAAYVAESREAFEAALARQRASPGNAN